MSQSKVHVFWSSALVFFLLFVASAAWKQSWFSSRVEYIVEFEKVEGLHPGSPVLISGFKAGDVRETELLEDGRVHVHIRVLKKFAPLIKEETKVLSLRPFLIGEKSLAIQVSPLKLAPLPPLSILKGEEAVEMGDLLNPSNAGKLLSQLQRSLAAIETVSQDLRYIRKDFASSEDMRKLVHDLAQNSKLNEALPALADMSKNFVTLLPEVQKIFQETLFTMQALQRSFILSGGVERLKKEQEKTLQRMPASSTSPAPADK